MRAAAAAAAWAACGVLAVSTLSGACAAFAPRPPQARGVQRAGLPACGRRPRLEIRAQLQNPVPTAREAWADEAIPAAKLLGPGDGGVVPAGGGDSVLSERVFIAVQTIRKRRMMLQKYAEDIQGRTGLGGIAALAYCRRVVNKRERVWGDLLMIVMERQANAVEELVLRAAEETLEAPITGEQWQWFRENLLSTYLWFSPSSVVPDSFVYERLLKIAEQNLRKQAAVADAMHFPALEGIPSRALLPGGAAEIRQDHRLVGNVPGIRQQLLGSADTISFYDLHVYLNDLLCIARIINPEFQAHMARLMAPMAGRALVEPGPLKSLQRCRAKVELEYAQQQWPTAAYLIDLVRVSVTFSSEEDLREGLRRILQSAGVPPAEFLRDTHVLADMENWDGDVRHPASSASASSRDARALRDAVGRELGALSRWGSNVVEEQIIRRRPRGEQRVAPRE